MPEQNNTKIDQSLKNAVDSGTFNGNMGEKGNIGVTAAAALSISKVVNTMTNSIDELNQKIEASSKSSNSLASSITIETWVGAGATIIMAVMSILPLFHQ